MNRLCVLLIACLLMGCGVFKQHIKKKSERSKRSTLVAKKEQEESGTEKHQLIMRDSLREELLIEIVPKGTFSYSLDSGFKGTGTAIKIRSKKKRVVEMLAKTESANVRQASEARDISEHKTETSQQRGAFKFKLNFSYYLIGLIIISLLWIWLKYKKN